MITKHPKTKIIPLEYILFLQTSCYSIAKNETLILID